MRNIIFSILMLLSFGVSQAIAGSGHDHGHGHSHGPVTEAEAVKRATQKVGQLAKAGKIDPTWATVTYSTVQQKSYGQGPEWVVTFNNDKVADSSKQTLYLFYTLSGNYLAANYTGQ